MKKIGLMLLVLLFAPLSHALDAKGTIDEIKICGTGKLDAWARTLQFKVDGKWFGIFSDFHRSTATDYDNNTATSLIMMAYAQNAVVEIHATSEWDHNLKKCGISEGGAFHVSAGDYIKLAR